MLLDSLLRWDNGGTARCAYNGNRGAVFFPWYLMSLAVRLKIGDVFCGKGDG